VNVLNMFEDRVGALFGESAGGQKVPFSSKKLAKKAAHEMENETYVINGKDTAPALYTVLVSDQDARVIRPVYEALTTELANFIEAQAVKRGYAFVGKPLVRFMADPSMKNGKFSVFAQNIDARTLERLRGEEAEYMGKRQSAPAGRKAVAPKPATSRPQAQAAHGSAVPLVSAQPARAETDKNAGLDVMPANFEDNLINIPEPAPAAPRHAASTPLVNAHAAQSKQPEGAASSSATCLLIDRQSGRTYTARSPRALIGRERTAGGIVLHDPNVSRRHAELSYDGTDWHITDLNSTNGTLVNNVDIDNCILRSGDLITIGLMNLEFREG
jgi:hypothetical protein